MLQWSNRGLAIPSIATIILISALFRLNPSSPSGFFIDEAAISAQVLCFQQSGHNLQGVHLPLFTEVLGGGYLTPTYLYPASGWVSIFGGSIASFRIFAGVCSLFFLGGVYLFARRIWNSQTAGWLATLAASISPWAFQFAKIAWDPAIAPAFLAWGFALLWGKRNWEAILSGALLSLAAYAYPPLRVQIAIILPFALYSLWSTTKNLRHGLMTFLTLILVSLPLIMATASGEIQGRFEMLSVFNPGFLSESYGSTNPAYAFVAIVDNLTKLLSPSFLFSRGDLNLRHSTGSFGIWSWLDLLALVAVFIEIARGLRKHRTWSVRGPAVVVAIGYLAGLIPAALTWESNPHALRSIGSILFLSVATGGALRQLWSERFAGRILIIAISFIFLVSFQRDFFGPYKVRSEIWFDDSVSRLATTLGDSGRIKDLQMELRESNIEYDEMALSYYNLYYKAQRCIPK